MQRKQHVIKINNKRENAKRSPYTYHVGQRGLIKAEKSAKYGSDLYLGPFIIEALHSINGTIEGTVSDT